MPANLEAPAADGASSSSSTQPKLRRLASKPLNLAASALSNLNISRTGSPAPSVASASTTHLPQTSFVSSKADIDSTPRQPRQRRKLGRKRHRPSIADGLLTPSQIASAARAPRKPLDGEEPAAVVRVRVVKAEGLVAKDRKGTSDPYVNLQVSPSKRESTAVVKKTLDPEFPAETSTFDFPLYLSLAGVVGSRGIEAVLWDKDLMRKEYMGEISIPLAEWFEEDDVRLWHENLPLVTKKVLSTRRRHRVSGSVSFRIGFVPPKGSEVGRDTLEKLRAVYMTFVERSYVGRRGIDAVINVPAHEGVGTVKMRSRGQFDPTPAAPQATAAQEHPAMALLHSTAAALVAPLSGGKQPRDIGISEIDDEEGIEDLKDDGLSSSSDTDSDDPGRDSIDYDTVHALEGIYRQSAGLPVSAPTKAAHTHRQSTDSSGPSSIGPATAPVPEMGGPSAPTPSKDYFSPMGKTVAESPGPATPYTPGAGTPGGSKRRPVFGRTKTSQKPQEERKSKSKNRTRDFNFNAASGHETLGIVIMEVKSASDLPRLKNALKIGFDMDPFVVISFGKKVFRTRVIRHSLNPTWDEKLLFHVHRHEAAYKIAFSVLDWDKISGNDLIGVNTLSLDELVSAAPKADPETGLYQKSVDGKHDMIEYVLPIATEKSMPWETKHSPKLSIRARYVPYAAMRQRFWRQYLMQYDADDTGGMTWLELTAMLDSLGSTLGKRTLEGYFESFKKNPHTDELTFDEVIICLEKEVNKSQNEKRTVRHNSMGTALSSGAATPSMQPQPSGDGLGVAGPNAGMSKPVDAAELVEHIQNSSARSQLPRVDHGAGNVQPLRPDAAMKRPSASSSSLEVPLVRLDRRPNVNISGDSSDAGSSRYATPSMTDNEDEAETLLDADGENGHEAEASASSGETERVITLRACPLCHRPRLGRKSEQDIVTHLAICASEDWSRVDRIVTANYVTSSQAQRKFFTRMMNKVAIGAYSLGANSANILVQDRVTGQLQEEKMAVYVRLGIRVLYKGAKGRMEGARARRLLKSLTLKQGLKYDSPTSALDIPAFIAFHALNTEEILDPIDSFKTFNQFFYRKLKPEARPIAEPANEGRMVSCADCRMMAFETVGEATRLWIKGREFTVGRLLGPEYKSEWDKFEGGALGIFRLAPQDYHRFHSPVKGKVGKMTLIDGEYYTVNPQAIRTSLDVYGENVRKIVPIESEEFGTVMTVWVGAMMVGSILTSVEEGQMIERGDELGYFAFGGSTIVCLFEKGALQWDDDLIENGQASIETLVRMGSGLGKSSRGTGSKGKTPSPQVSPAATQ